MRYDIWEQPKDGLGNGRYWETPFTYLSNAAAVVEAHKRCCQDLILEAREEKKGNAT
jgi:hypothetical protein